MKTPGGPYGGSRGECRRWYGQARWSYDVDRGWMVGSRRVVHKEFCRLTDSVNK